MSAAKKNKNTRITKNTFIETVLNIFRSNPHRGYNFRQIAHALGIQDKASKQVVKDILLKLEKSKDIIEARRGKYKLNPKSLKKYLESNTITGIVDMKQTGKAYIIAKELDEDIFIAANNTYHALNGDTVKVQLFPKRSGRKTEGRIVEVLKRGKKQIVGIIEVSSKYAFLIPDDVSVPVDIYIPLSNLKGATSGQKVIVKITDWPDHSKNPFGEVTDILGKPGEHQVEMQSILADFGFPVSFPKNVTNEVEQIDLKISNAEIARRKDFRKIFTCTIDPKDAKDFDDALSLKKLENGNWEVGIHIADVSHYVKPGSLVDGEGYDRGTSIYLVDRVIPMLPEKLSNELCSLKPKEEKLCFSAVFEMTENAEIVKDWYGETIIYSDRRYNYEEVQEIIEGGSDEFSEQILVLHQLSSKLREKRFKDGAIAFSSHEVKFELDESGKPIGAFIKEQTDSNRLVEDFMLLANRKIAELVGRRHGKQEPRTFIYRVHDEPNPEKLQTFAEFITKFGYKLNIGSRKSISSSMNQLFKMIRGKGEENMIEKIAVRTMSKAEYTVNNIGHYGLAFKYYTHFTSPIRRYPDLIVHRLLKIYLEGAKSVNPAEYEEKCVHASEMERKALDAERASIKYKQAEYLLDKVGQEFNGLISGVSKWGLFVELDGNKCEGMVSLKYLDDDFYYLDEDNYMVVGQSHGKEYRLGDPIRIKVKRIDLGKKQMDFILA